MYTFIILNMLNRIIAIVFILTCYGVILSRCQECEDVTVSGVLKRVTVSNCNLSEPPCNLKKGTTVNVTIVFISGLNTTGLIAKAFASLGKAEMQFKALNPKACEPQFGLDCPLESGAEYTYENSIAIEKSFPTLSHFHTKWLLIDDTDLPVICVKIATSIR